MIVLKWRATLCFVPDGAGSMEVPSAQSFELNNDFGANSGFIVVPGTNNSPTAGNITTACNTMATNAAAGFNTGPNLARIDAWGAGGP